MCDKTLPHSPSAEFCDGTLACDVPRLDPDGLRAAGSKGPQPLIDPSTARRAGEGHRLSLSRFARNRNRCRWLTGLHLYTTVSKRYRMEGGPRMRLPNT